MLQRHRSVANRRRNPTVVSSFQRRDLRVHSDRLCRQPDHSKPDRRLWPVQPRGTHTKPVSRSQTEWHCAANRRTLRTKFESRLKPKKSVKSIAYGGGRGIRTLGTVSRTHAFQACAFNHSATPPDTGRSQRRNISRCSCHATGNTRKSVAPLQSCVQPHERAV